MKMIDAIKITIRDIRFYAQFWGLWSAMQIRLFTKFSSILHGDDFSKRETSAIQRKLRVEFSHLIKQYKTRTTEHATPISSNTPIWVCWWQGEDQMPEMVKQCFKFIVKNSNGHNVNLITKENYSEFIDIPDYVIQKVSDKSITLAFLSDIIRTSLLAKYGGLWIDSTYWVTRPLNIDGYKFFSIRQNRFSGGISDFRWAPSCLGTGESWYVFEFLRDCLLTHIQLHPTNVTYLLIDHVINIAHDEFPEFGQLVDNLPDTKEHIYIMPWLFNQKLDKNKLKEVLDSSPLLKLTIKQENLRKTPEGERTYYDYFICL